MDKTKVIEQFVARHCPPLSACKVNTVRHTKTTLAKFLNCEPTELEALATAGLLQAGEPWPGCPSLQFSTLHLHSLKREILRKHAADAIELCAGHSELDTAKVIEMSWNKRTKRVIELSQKTS